MNTKTRPRWACFGVQRVPLFFPSSRTPKTRPFGACFWCPTHLLPLLFLSNTKTCPTRACFGVRRVSTPSPRTEHHKHAHKGVFVVSDMFPPPNTLPRLPLCAEHQKHRVSGVPHVLVLPSPLEYQKRALGGTFLVFGTYPTYPSLRISMTVPLWARFLVFGATRGSHRLPLPPIPSFFPLFSYLVNSHY